VEAGTEDGGAGMCVTEEEGVWSFDQAWRSDASGAALPDETSIWMVLDGGSGVRAVHGAGHSSGRRWSWEQ
jgi:hypothetical protein